MGARAPIVLEFNFNYNRGPGPLLQWKLVLITTISGLCPLIVVGPKGLGPKLIIYN